MIVKLFFLAVSYLYLGFGSGVIIEDLEHWLN
jgi:hypothetical protein